MTSAPTRKPPHAERGPLPEDPMTQAALVSELRAAIRVLQQTILVLQQANLRRKREAEELLWDYWRLLAELQELRERVKRVEKGT
jgi:hypothetical protein